MSERLTLSFRQEAAAHVRERVEMWVRDAAGRGIEISNADRAAKLDAEFNSWQRMRSQQLVTTGQAPLDDREVAEMRGFVNASFGLLPAAIQQLVDTDLYSDIHVMGTRAMVAERRDGSREAFPSPFGSTEEFMATVRRWASTGMSREFSDAAPILDMTLGDRIRVAASHAVSDEPEMSLRISSDQFRDLSQLQAAGMFSKAVAGVLTAAVRAGCSIIVCGATGSGKTTLVRALMGTTPKLTRVVIVEDERELRFDRSQHLNVVNFAARPANIAGEGEISMSQLVKASLRRKPDWVVVGECRGPEAFQLVKASTQGNSVMSTLHANSTNDMVDRLSLFISEAGMGLSPEYIAKLIGKGVDLVVHVDVVDGKRMVSDVVEITGSIDTSLSLIPWFSPGPSGAAQLDIPTRSELMDRLIDAGLDRDLITPTFAPLGLR
jgi:pilus assembly protein CpaF